MASIVCAALAVVAVPGRSEAADGRTYTSTETIPVPPASAYAGSGGGDGWGIALGSTSVYNIFHHSSSLTVACHQQADASQCWSPRTITDTVTGSGFASSGQPGMWLDQATGLLYTYATRSSDVTGGVVCIDTVLAGTSSNPFCGFTPLTAPGEATLASGISTVSDPVVVANRFYAFNYVSGAGSAGSSQNKLLCYDLGAHAACNAQPYLVSFLAGTVTTSGYPAPSIAAMGDQIIVPVSIAGVGDQLACFDTRLAGGSCAGAWPVSLTNGYVGNHGAPFPLLTSTGGFSGVCLPTGSDPCFDLLGASVGTPTAMSSVISGSDQWNGPAFTLGPRVYVPNGNANSVQCYDYATNASCTSFPKTFSSLGYLYTVNPDPQRPTCIWVNADNGGGQIQNFDAYTSGGCGSGAIRVRAASLVIPQQKCVPTSYTSIQVLQPPRTAYASGSVAFEDGDANPIAGLPDKPLDNTGTVSLTGLGLSTNFGLPQFLITLLGVQAAPASVQVQLTWMGIDDPGCAPAGSATYRYVALGDSVPYGHGLANPTKTTKDGLPPNQGPSSMAWPQLVDNGLPGLKVLKSRPTSCDLGGHTSTVYDQLAISGAPSIDNRYTGRDDDCHYRGPVPQHKAVFLDEVTAANLAGDSPALVTLQVGADDVNFAGCLASILGEPGIVGLTSPERCFDTNRDGTYRVRPRFSDELTSLTAGLKGTIAYIHNKAPHARIVLVDYYQIIPGANAPLSGSTRVCQDLRFARPGGDFRTHIRAEADFLQEQLDQTIRDVASAFPDVIMVELKTAFEGHEMCTNHRWLLDGTWDAAHPNTIGQQIIAKAVLDRCATVPRRCVGR